MPTEFATMVPAIPQIRVAPDGTAALHAVRCTECGQTHFVRPMACQRCFSRAPMQEFALRGEGHLYSYTIVHRSYPGIRTPFVMAVVEMAEGPVLRANLDVDPDPQAIAYDMPVRVRFRDSGQQDAQGRHFLSFAFVDGRERP